MESENTIDTHDVSRSDSVKGSAPQTHHNIYHCIFPSKSRDHLLAEILPNGIARLPRTEIPVSISQYNEEAMERYIEAECGLAVYLVRELRNGHNNRTESVDGVEINHLYLGDVLDEQPMVRKPYEWIHRNVACTLEWVTTNGDGDKDHVPTELKNVFGEINGELPWRSQMLSWMNVGWYEEITSWTLQMLEERSMVMEGRIRERSRTFQSAVMMCEVKMQGEGKIEGKRGSCEKIFIKSILPSLREVERTVAIAHVVGNIVPEIICFSEQEGRLMQRNGGKIKDEAVDQAALIDTILKIQRLSMDHISDLEVGGLKVRDSEWVESNVESILNHELLDMYYLQDGDVNEEYKEIVDNVRAKVGLVQKNCREVTNLGLPRTIVHGDLHESNIGSPVICEGKVYRIYDWARSFIGNPLHDFEYLLPGKQPAIDNIYGELSIDVEAAVTQIGKQWKVCATLTVEEIRSLCVILSDMTTVVWINDLIEEYKACDENTHRHTIGRILSDLGECMDFI